MRIQQVCSLNGFFDRAIRNKYGLSPYTDIHAPVLFFGMFPKRYRYYIHHKGPKIVAWAGSDALVLWQHPQMLELFKRDDAINIAISSYLSNDLTNLGIKHITLPIVPFRNDDIQPEPLGDELYYYFSVHKKDLYGYDIYQEIKKKINFKINVCESTYFSRNDLLQIYKKCFCGLRLTRHDGMSNTVVELGLMGRQVLWNGNAPNAIKYTNIDNICHKINKLYKNKPDINETHEQMKKFLKLPDFLDTKFYESKYYNKYRK